MELFKLSANSYIDPKYLRTYNQPARDNVSEIRISELYQFGQLNVFKSICLTDEEMTHVLSLLSNNTMQNQKGLEALNQLVATEGVSPVTKIDAKKKRQIIMVDTDVTNNIILGIQGKIQAMNAETKVTGKRGSFEIEFTKREIFLMYFVLDIACVVDLYMKRSDITLDGKNHEEFEKQKKRVELTDSARNKLSVFFNPNLPFEKVEEKKD